MTIELPELPYDKSAYVEAVLDHLVDCRFAARNFEKWRQAVDSVAEGA